MAVFDAYPTGMNLNTDITDTLGDYTIFCNFRCFWNGSPSYAKVVDRGVTDDIWAGRGNASDIMGGGAFNPVAPHGTFSGGPSGLLPNTWYPLIVQRQISNTTLTVRAAGDQQTNAAVNTTISNAGRAFMVGANYSTGAFGILGGFSRLAIWNTYLTSKEHLSLEAGFSPLQIRPSSLIVYAPFLGNQKNYFGKRKIGETGSNVFTINNLCPRLVGAY